LPLALDLETDCGRMVEDKIIGFSYTELEANAGYEGPVGDYAGADLPTWERRFLPGGRTGWYVSIVLPAATVSPYCDDLELGLLGFSYLR
jgi:hypothetical protein